MLPTEEILTVLNGLIEVCKDSAEGFERAADSSSSLELQNWFRRRCRQRQRMSEQIQAEVRRLGGNPLDSGTSIAAEEHEWGEILGPLVRHSDHQLAEDCWRWELQTRSAYEDALCEILPQTAHDLAIEHLTVVKDATDRLQALTQALPAEAAPGAESARRDA